MTKGKTMTHEHSRQHLHEGGQGSCTHGHGPEKKHSHDHARHGRDHGHSHEHGHVHDHVQDGGHGHSHSACDSCACTVQGVRPEPASVSRHPKGLPVFYIDSMDCSVEENDIRQILSKINGIRGLNFHLASRTLSIDANREIVEKSVAAIKKAGYRPEAVVTAGPEINVPKKEGRVWHLWLALAIAVAVEILHFAAGDVFAVKVGGMALSAIAIWLSGFSTYRKGLAALMQLRLNINALMTVAVTGAFLIGQWPEAAMVMALYAIAELIEARSVDRARNAIRNLLDLTPPTAEIRQDDGVWRTIPVREVALGMLVRVRPGGRIPLDGIVENGNGTVDQSPVTGESIPVDKKPGDPVFAGTINESGILEFAVTALASDTVVARIIRAVEDAQEKSAPTQRFVDKFAAVYTPLVFLFAFCVAVLTPFLFGWTWMQSVYKALVMLVIACPCALVIATPVTVVSGLAAAARKGILMKGGVYLEEARKIRVVALDKTGTVTEGKPRLLAVETIPSEFAEEDVLSWAMGLADSSAHPVSRAIATGLDRPAKAVTAFADLPGRGVKGTVEGHELVMGNHRLIEEKGLCVPDVHNQLLEYEKRGYTVTVLASPVQVLALFAVADTIRPSSREALAELKKRHIVAVMLTGDNETTARTIADEAGIENVRGNLLPSEKMDAVRELQRRYGMTAMIGDGINDAPALAHADIGIAMGDAGTDIAMEAADVVIMNDDLRRIPQMIGLSADTCSILWQNILIALGIKLVFFGLALFGMATMWMAVFADMGASLLVLLNGLRVLGK